MIVFIDGSNLHKTPKPVQDAIASDEADGPTPIVVTFDSKIKNRLAIVDYFSMKDPTGFDDVRRALARFRGKKDASDKLVRNPTEVWTDRRGRTVRAAYIKSDDEEVTLRLENGRVTTQKLSILSEASQKRVAQLAKQ